MRLKVNSGCPDVMYKTVMVLVFYPLKMLSVLLHKACMSNMAAEIGDKQCKSHIYPKISVVKTFKNWPLFKCFCKSLVACPEVQAHCSRWELHLDIITHTPANANTHQQRKKWIGNPDFIVEIRNSKNVFYAAYLLCITLFNRFFCFPGPGFTKILK